MIIKIKISRKLVKSTRTWLSCRGLSFYRLCRDGKTQAENFIATVPNKADALPPLLIWNMTATVLIPIPKEQLLKEIGIMHDSLKHHYGKQPIFYISKTFTTLY